VTIVASITLLPALLGFAGERMELTRWRGLIAAGFAASRLFGRASTSCRCSSPAGCRVVLIAGFFAGPLKREVPMRRQKPHAGDDSPTGGAASFSVTRGPSAHRRPAC
jgi:RND superfamily putative drug exporter